MFENMIPPFSPGKMLRTTRRGTRRIDSNWASLLPHDGTDCLRKRVESAFDDIDRMRVDKLCSLMIDSRCAIVHLEVNLTEIIVGVVLMPPDE